MTKAEFVASVAEKTGTTKAAATEAVEAFICTVAEALKAGDKISFRVSGRSVFQKERLVKVVTRRLALRSRSRPARAVSLLPARI